MPGKGGVANWPTTMSTVGKNSHLQCQRKKPLEIRAVSQSQPFDVVSLKSNAGSCSLGFRFFGRQKSGKKSVVAFGSYTPQLQIKVNCRSLGIECPQQMSLNMYVPALEEAGLDIERERECKYVDIHGDRNRDREIDAKIISIISYG